MIKICHPTKPAGSHHKIFRRAAVISHISQTRCIVDELLTFLLDPGTKYEQLSAGPPHKFKYLRTKKLTWSYRKKNINFPLHLCSELKIERLVKAKIR